MGRRHTLKRVPAVCGRLVISVILWAPSGHIDLKISFFELKRRRLKSCKEMAHKVLVRNSTI